MSDEPGFTFPDKPAYGVPKTVDYTLLNQIDTPDEHEHADGPGFDNEAELPESDYPEEGDEDGEPGNDPV